MKAVPVFLYHSVSEDPPPWIAPVTVSPRVFRDQIERIIDSGLDVVPLRRLVSAILGGPPLPPRAAVLTFDEGFADFYWTIAPLLADRGLPATLYLTVGAIHPPGGEPSGSLLPRSSQMLNWRQVSTLDALGVEIGGHSQTHAQLDTVRGGRLQDEIVGSKRRLEEALGHDVAAFAYPHGYSSPAVRRTLREAGWTSATAVHDRFSSTADHPLAISRLTVRSDTSPQRFQQWTTGAGAGVAPVPEGPYDKAHRAYRRLRAALGRPAGLPRE